MKNPVKANKNFNKKVQQYSKNVEEQITNEHNIEIICREFQIHVNCISIICISTIWNGPFLYVFIFYEDKEILFLWENERSL